MRRGLPEHSPFYRGCATRSPVVSGHLGKTFLAVQVGREATWNMCDQAVGQSLRLGEPHLNKWGQKTKEKLGPKMRMLWPSHCYAVLSSAAPKAVSKRLLDVSTWGMGKGSQSHRLLILKSKDKFLFTLFSQSGLLCFLSQLMVLPPLVAQARHCKVSWNSSIDNPDSHPHLIRPPIMQFWETASILFPLPMLTVPPMAKIFNSLLDSLPQSLPK